jgi:hypothetical protein
MGSFLKRFEKYRKCHCEVCGKIVTASEVWQDGISGWQFTPLLSKLLLNLSFSRLYGHLFVLIPIH